MAGRGANFPLASRPIAAFQRRATGAVMDGVEASELEVALWMQPPGTPVAELESALWLRNFGQDTGEVEIMLWLVPRPEKDLAGAGTIELIGSGTLEVVPQSTDRVLAGSGTIELLGSGTLRIELGNAINLAGSGVIFLSSDIALAVVDPIGTFPVDLDPWRLIQTPDPAAAATWDGIALPPPEDPDDPWTLIPTPGPATWDPI